MSGIKAIQFAAVGVLAASASAYASAPGCKATDAHCVSGVAPASLQLGTVGAVRAGLGPDRKIPSKISVDAGSYRINGGEFSNAPGFVNDGDIVSLRMPAAHHCGTVVTQTLRIEGQSDRVFRVITRGDAAPLSAAAYASTDVTTSMPWAHYGKLTLPVDEDGKPGADEVEGADVGNYSSQYWYQPAKGQRTRSGYIASGDETVFWAPVNGTGRTKTATTPRTEMREQISVGDNSINWGLSGNHVQKGTVVLTAIPTPIRSNTRTFIVFAQIHSVGNAPPIKLFFQRLPNGSTEVLSNYNTKPVKGASVNSPVKIAVRLGEKFTYEIRLVNGTVTTIVNGTVLDVRNMSKAWKGEEFFFKAGDYLGNNDGTARGFGEVLYTDIHVSHQ